VTDDLAQVPPEIRAEVEAGVSRPSPAPAAPAASDATAPAAPPAAPAPQAEAPRPAAAPAPAKATRAARRHVIEVERGGLELAVTALLDGRVRANFKVDTGATINTIPRRVIDELGVAIDESTPLIAVTGISGKPQLVPVVVIGEVRLGDAAVENVEAAVLDTLDYGLLGMPFFNHFRVEVDPSAGRLTLEELEPGSIEGQHGGYPEDYWRGRFAMIRAQLEQIDAARERLPEHFGEFHERLDAAERYWQEQELDLEERASRAGVPRAWRE
jgi:predicted aspartyl protease